MKDWLHKVALQARWLFKAVLKYHRFYYIYKFIQNKVSTKSILRLFTLLGVHGKFPFMFIFKGIRKNCKHFMEQSVMYLLTLNLVWNSTQFEPIATLYIDRNAVYIDLNASQHKLQCLPLCVGSFIT